MNLNDIRKEREAEANSPYMRAPNQRCKDCRWWEDTAVKCGESIMAPPITGGGPSMRIGSCHRHYDRPTALEDDWCGDWEIEALSDQEIIEEIKTSLKGMS